MAITMGSTHVYQRFYEKYCISQCFFSFSHLNLFVFCRNPEILDECKIDDDVKQVLINDFKCRFSLQPSKIRAGKDPGFLMRGFKWPKGVRFGTLPKFSKKIP